MTLRCAWENYWFRPAPLFDLGMLRVVAVGFQLCYLATIRPATLRELAALPDFLYAPVLVLRLMLLPLGWEHRLSGDGVLAVYWVTLAAGVPALVGYWTRISLLLFAAGSIFVQGFIYSFHEIHHAEALVLITLALLVLSPAGRGLSVDDLLRRLRAVNRGHSVESDPHSVMSRHAGWPLLLVQWLFALIYLSAAYHKLAAGGLDWMNGWTLQYYMLQDAMRWDSDLGLWIARYRSVASIASWASILFESLFWVVLVFPRATLIVVPIGIGFHAAVYAIQRAPFFGFIFLYVVFVPWARVLRRFGEWFARHAGRPVLRYDPQSRRSVRRATVIRYLDCFGITVLVPSTASSGRP